MANETENARHTDPTGGGGATMPDAPRVAVIGARGIGRHHAKWWHLERAEVCAIVGTSTATVAEAVAKLQGMFDFSGRGYTDIGDMLARENPDLVDVCSSTERHGEHVRGALEAGCHVLCEKPFVYDAAKSRRQLLDEADALIRLAEVDNRVLGMCSQYFVAGERCLARLRGLRPDVPLTAIQATLASPAKGRAPDPLAVWIDLGPHVLAAVQAVMPDAGARIEDLRLSNTGYHTRCRFRATHPDTGGLACTLHVYRTEGEPRNIRNIVLNDMEFDLQGENDAEGVFQAKIVTPMGTFREDDVMRQLIRRTAAGRTPMTGAVIRQNLEWLLDIAAGISP